MKIRITVVYNEKGQFELGNTDCPHFDLSEMVNELIAVTDCKSIGQANIEVEVPDLEPVKIDHVVDRDGNFILASVIK